MARQSGMSMQTPAGGSRCAASPTANQVGRRQRWAMPTRIMSNPDDAGYRPQASGEQGQVGALACCGM